MKTCIDGSISQAIQASESRMMAYFESAILPKFDLLADGHKTILEIMAPKSRVEALEDEMIFMKSVIKSLTREIEKLKKAQ